MTNKPSYEELQKRVKDLEATLKDFESEQTLILDLQPYHCVIQDLNNRVVWANRAACESVGMSRKDLLGRFCYEIWAQRAIQCPDCPVNKAVQTKEPQDLEKRTSDGRIWHIRGYPLKDHTGRVTRTLEVTEEITERKLAEDALSKSEAQNRSILITAMDGFLLLDLQGHILEVNQAYCQMSGYSPEELRGMHIVDLEADHRSEEIDDHILKIVIQGKDRFETRQVRKDGGHYDVEVSVQYHPFEGGRIVAFLQDITERKQMEETLRKSEEKYKKLINTSPDSIALIDESGQFLTINPAMATRLGSSPEKIEGKNFYHVLPGDVAFKRLEKGKEAIAKKEVIYFEDSRDGMHFQNYHIPVDICGDKRCFQIIAKDMTQRKQMEERLQILKDAVESSINGFALADLCGYLTYINPSFLRIGKFDNDVDVLGRHFSEFLPKKKKAFFSWQTLNSQSAWKGELIAKRSDNTLIYIQLFASVVKDKQGTPVCLMGSFIDITDRKKAEKELYQANKHLEQRVIERTQELKKHESRLKRSQQVARVATWERDFQTGEIIWSDEQYRLFGYEPSQLSEREIIKRHISEEDLQQIKGHLRQAIQERQGFNIRFGFTTQDHQQRIAHCLGQVERDEADNPLHIYGTTQDVTEKIEMEQALYKSQQSYEQLLLSTQHLISYKDIIGKSKQMRRIYTLIQQLANVDTTVLITGESGTGKELVMKALHYSGLRAKGPLIKVNCSALSEQLLESELFGHIRGAFTGAVCQKAGRIESAQGGTLFLDEIGEISQNTQLKLLRFLQEKQFERVGEVSPISADVRIIAATNADLSQKVVQGSFRSDLYYRLKVIPIYICPLRERTEDIPLLVRHFCRYFSQSFQKKIVGVSDEVMRFFITYQWPGNVRELKHVIESACIVCSGKIGLEHLPDNLVMRQSNQQEETMGSIFKKKKIGEEELRDALKEARGNKTKAAGLLGVSRRTVYRKISEYHLG